MMKLKIFLIIYVTSVKTSVTPHMMIKFKNIEVQYVNLTWFLLITIITMLYKQYIFAGCIPTWTTFLCQEKLQIHLFCPLVLILMLSFSSHNQQFIVDQSPSHNMAALQPNSSPPGRDGRHFVDDVLRCIFMNEKLCILIRISLKFVPRGQLTIAQHWFR